MPLNAFTLYVLSRQPFAAFAQLAAPTPLALEPTFHHPQAGKHRRGTRGKLNRALQDLGDQVVKRTPNLCSENPDVDEVYSSINCPIPPSRAHYDALRSHWVNAAGVEDSEVWMRPEHADTLEKLFRVRDGSEPASAELVLTRHFLDRSLAEAATWERVPREKPRESGEEPAYGDRYCSVAQYVRADGRQVTVCCPWVAQWREIGAPDSSEELEIDRRRVLAMLGELYQESRAAKPEDSAVFLVLAPKLPPKTARLPPKARRKPRR